jgi:hypothetical protein
MCCSKYTVFACGEILCVMSCICIKTNDWRFVICVVKLFEKILHLLIFKKAPHNNNSGQIIGQMS